MEDHSCGCRSKKRFLVCPLRRAVAESCKMDCQEARWVGVHRPRRWKHSGRYVNDTRQGPDSWFGFHHNRTRAATLDSECLKALVKFINVQYTRNVMVPNSLIMYLGLRTTNPTTSDWNLVEKFSNCLVNAVMMQQAMQIELPSRLPCSMVDPASPWKALPMIIRRDVISVDIYHVITCRWRKIIKLHLEVFGVN